MWTVLWAVWKCELCCERCGNVNCAVSCVEMWTVLWQSKMQEDYQTLKQLTDVERHLCDRLEQQVNDLTELHQEECAHIRQVSAFISRRHCTARLSVALGCPAVCFRSMTLKCGLKVTRGHWWWLPSPPFDHIWALMIDRRVRVKNNGTVVHDTVH